MDSVKTIFAETFWRAPLVPAALVITTGIVVDRLFQVPLLFSLGMGVGCLAAWGIARSGRQQGLSLVYLALAGFAVGAALHHYRHDVFPADDIGNHLPAKAANAREKEPPIQVRGVLEEEPLFRPTLTHQPLRFQPQPASTSTVLQVTSLRKDGDWSAVSGRLRLHVEGRLEDIHCGDEVELTGQLVSIEGPTNPGEPDLASYWRDQGVRAQLFISKPADGAKSSVSKLPARVVRLSRNWSGSFWGWLGFARSWGQQEIVQALATPRQGHQIIPGLGAALVLGEGAPLRREDWEKYKRTGVIHVLIVSGQHLVILAAFLWWMLRRLGVRQRHSAWIVALVVFLYVLLTGGHPPGLRSAVTVCAACVGLMLRRRIVPANLLALAWLTVAVCNPTDLFRPGCLLSFLCVIVLYRFTVGWSERERDPLQQLIDENRPPWERLLRKLGGVVGESYLVSLVLWLTVTPLVAFNYHLVPFSAAFLGPPLTLLTSIALFAGFILLLLAVLHLPFVPFAAWFIHWALSLCDSLVDWADGMPGSHTYISNIPLWWIVVFYLALLLYLTQSVLLRYWQWALLGGLGWLCLGLFAALVGVPTNELRCTFLDVGHGGCTVVETPDGRTLLYDAGAIGGPQVTERHIAPYLWQRGIRHIDEVFLSHADLDHFNGLPALLDRFAVAQVTCTPTFADKNTPGVEYTLEVLRSRKVPIRIVKAGDLLTAGIVTLEVLHPPEKGPDGIENIRSLVLRLNYAGQTILLTGDLEGGGLEQVLGKPTSALDVLMAPHHGSHRIDAEGLVKWARPRVVIASMGIPRSPKAPPAVYGEDGRYFFSTNDSGAVTVRCHSSGLIVETFLHPERLALPPRKQAGR